MTSSGLETAKGLIDIFGTLVTTVAVVVGGIWAYFKFIKGRTYRPHVEVAQSGEWLGSTGSLGFKATVTLKNIGAAKVELRQKGTGLRISRLAATQREPPSESSWESLGVFEIFTQHEWIEPGETIADELLVRLPLDPQTLQVETRLVLPWKKRIVLAHVGQKALVLPWTHDRNVTVHARRVLSYVAAGGASVHESTPMTSSRGQHSTDVEASLDAGALAELHETPLPQMQEVVVDTEAWEELKSDVFGGIAAVAPSPPDEHREGDSRPGLKDEDGA